MPDEFAIDPELLHLLLEAEQPLNIETLAQCRGCTQRQLMTAINRLREAGCDLQQQPYAGLWLVETGLGAWLDYLQWQFGTRRWLQVYRRTRSTQNLARQLVHTRGPAAAGAVVVADQQTAGRGRLGRTWLAPPATAVMFSTVVPIAAGSTYAAIERLSLATSVAIAEALDPWLSKTGLRTRIKWPNDICVSGRKLAGILVETTGRSAIVGVGINVALTHADIPAENELTAKTTSLSMCGLQVDRLNVLARCLSSIDEHLKSHDAEALRHQWRQRSLLLNQHLSLASDGQQVHGQVIDLDPHAGLLVRNTEGHLLHLPAATTSLNT
jgi:BirA family biotin operon repressor/biotin-[acetyl-CoA-carboxylase] ligase